LDGLEERLGTGHSVDRLASVASFFVSRIDNKVDGYLDRVIASGGKQAGLAQSLKGKLAIANARLAFRQYRQVFEGPRFAGLASRGAGRQRPLWASTSTKNPAYRDVLYVESLIGPGTINTVPPQTLQAFLDHGRAELTIENDLDSAERDFRDLAAVGISFDQVTQELEDEGVKAFADSYDALIETISGRI